MKQDSSFNNQAFDKDDPFAMPPLAEQAGAAQGADIFKPLDGPLVAPILSSAAAKRILALQGLENQPDAGLRLKVLGGGCSGYQYDFSLCNQQTDDDMVIKTDGASLYVDQASLPFLSGAEIDYVDDLTGAWFVVKNPNSKSSCGCGVSFSF